MGFASKATRYRDCHVTGVPVDCVACGERYFSRYRCTLRYCDHCGPMHFSRLLGRYRVPISFAIMLYPNGKPRSQDGRTLAGLDFTIRAEDRIPEAEKPRGLMKLIRQWFKRMMPEGSTWGCIFAVETGHELAVKHPGRKAGGWNLHVHVLYYGPYLKHAKGLSAWEELLGESGGFRIKQCPGWRNNPEQAVRRALVHHFGYIMKPAAVSGERIAALEVLFSGTRRVHALGMFYRLPKVPKLDVVNPRCPKCGQDLPINLKAWHKGERRPVTTLAEDGRQDWRALEAENRRAQAFGGRAP
jgi:hypothetical protein